MSFQSHKKTSISHDGKNEKKKFDKKKFWDKKYNIKNRVQQWEDKRQQYIKRKYQKELKKNKINLPPSSTSNLTAQDEPSNSEPFRRLDSLKSAQLELKRRKEEKQKQIDAKVKKRAEMEEAIQKYKKKKAEKFKKLSKKTKKGQPVMKDRLKLLLEEIKQKVAEES